jgi:hypothetical protein
MPADVCCQFFVYLVIFDHQQKARCILVDTVNDSRPDHSVQIGKGVPAVREQCVDKCAFIMSRSGMNHHPLGFIDNQEPFILIYDPERNVLRDGAIRPWRRQINLNGPSRLSTQRGFYRFITQRNPTVIEQPFDINFWKCCPVRWKDRCPGERRRCLPEWF